MAVASSAQTWFYYQVRSFVLVEGLFMNVLSRCIWEMHGH